MSPLRHAAFHGNEIRSDAVQRNFRCIPAVQNPDRLPGCTCGMKEFRTACSTVVRKREPAGGRTPGPMRSCGRLLIIVPVSETRRTMAAAGIPCRVMVSSPRVPMAKDAAMSPVNMMHRNTKRAIAPEKSSL